MDANAADVAKRRASSACDICHQKKVRCDYVENSAPCSSCRALNYECRPRERKRKRYTVRPSAGPENDFIQISHHRKNSEHQKDNRSREGQRSTFREETRPHGAAISPAASDRSFAHQTSMGQECGITGQSSQNQSYLGRSEYIGGDVQIDEDIATDYQPIQGGTISEADIKILQMQQAFSLPPQSIRNSLIDNFMTRCSPWMPIVSRSSLEVSPSGDEKSILLLQAVFLSGSRFNSAPLTYVSCEELYRRTKALFFSGYEKYTITVISASVLIQFWNPSGPEHVSIESSSFWLRIGVGLAFQIGLHREPRAGSNEASLRRRLFWTLFARDCLISAGQGRPRAINLADCDVRPISLNDFPEPNKNARLFVAYVEICSILGDLTEFYIRNDLSRRKRVSMEGRVIRWIQDLPKELRLYQEWPRRGLAAYDFEARQLHVPYFTTLIFLDRSASPTSGPMAVTVLSSSFLAGIFEDFLARDELRFLGPIFTFYLFVAGLSQLSCHQYPDLVSISKHELSIINLSLQELSRKWSSAIGPEKVIENLTRGVGTPPPASKSFQPKFSTEQLAFFSMFGPDFCRKWDPVFKSGISSAETSGQVNPNSASQIAGAGSKAHPRTGIETVDTANGRLQNTAPFDVLESLALYPQQGYEPLDGDVGLDFANDSVGNWLSNDWGFTEFGG